MVIIQMPLHNQPLALLMLCTTGGVGPGAGSCMSPYYGGMGGGGGEAICGGFCASTDMCGSCGVGAHGLEPSAEEMFPSLTGSP